ncbi:MAG TPA: EamA family transporter [Burkholderiales bacterium]|nr:EamA family transporter [Burkholderiales bacterium]
MNKKSCPRSAALAPIVLGFIWGYNWVVMKKVLAFCGPFDFAALRTFFGALCLFAVLAWMKKPLRPVEIKGKLLLGLLQTTVFTALIMWSVVDGGAGKTAVLSYTMTFWLLILAWPLLHERIHGAQWLAVSMALAGLFFILEPWHPQGNLASSIAATAAGIVWAAAVIVAKKLRSRVQLDLLSLTAWQMLLGGTVLVGITFFIPQQPIELSGYFWFAVIYNAVLGTALAWLLWLYVLQHLPAGAAGLGSLMVPVVGVLSAWLELGEQPKDWEIAGMLLIGAALLLLSILGMREPKVDPEMAQE